MQALQHMPQVISSLDEHVENGLRRLISFAFSLVLCVISDLVFNAVSMRPQKCLEEPETKML